MRKFKFRLQTVLDQRKAIEDKLLGELGALRLREQEETARLDAMHAERENLWQKIARGDSSFLELRDADAYAAALADDIRVQCLTIETIRRQVDEKIAEIVEASKERKLIEKLREKHFEAHRKETAALEQKASDDNASLRYAREVA